MRDPNAGPQSDLANQIIQAGSYAKLVVSDGTCAAARDLLSNATPDQLLTVPVVNYPAACAVLAGLWLWHDGLHECHEIVQKSPKDVTEAARYPHAKASKPGQ